VSVGEGAADAAVAHAQAGGEALLDNATQLAHEAAGDVLGEGHELEVSAGLHLREPASSALLHEAADADLLVVGPRGQGGVAGLLLGSTAVALAQQAPCPLVVVRGAHHLTPGEAAGRVVVGTDGSALSAPAVRFAFAEAERRGVGVVAVRAWTRPWIPGPVPSDDVLDWSALEAQARQSLAKALEESRSRHPDVDVVEKVVGDRAGTALVELSPGAELVVVGSRGRGRLASAVLGSVSHYLLHHAQCPVALVRR
jgi:nucleotide-binding universal stress UspA family protein